MANTGYNGAADILTPSPVAPSAAKQPVGVATSPGAFGAGTAQGMEAAGEGAMKAAHFFGEAAADNAYNSYQDSLNKILRGDPNKKTTLPDGTVVPDSGYMGLKGEEAMKARPVIEKQMEELREATKRTLPSADMQLMFNRNARRFQSVSSSQIGTHADTQSNVWMEKVNTDGAKGGFDTISQSPTDPKALLEGREQVRKFYVRNAQHKFGSSPEIISEAIRSADRDSIKAQILAIGAHPDGAPAAMRIIENSKAELGTAYPALYDHFRARAESEGAVGGGINLFNELNAAPPSTTLTPKTNGVKADAQSSLGAQGIPLKITSEARTPERNRAVGGAPNSQHVSGQAMDIALAGYSDDQKQKVLDQFLKDPRVTGIGWEGDHLHVDTGARGQRTAWGADDTPASLAKAPAWVQEKVNAWKGAAPAQVASADKEEVALNAPPDLKTPETPLERLSRVTEQGVQRIEQMNLPAKQKEQMLNAFRTQVATHEMSINLAKKAADDIYHKALGGYVDDMVVGRTGDIVQRINQDPRVPPEHKMALIEMARKESGNPQSVVSFGPGWKDATVNVLKKPGEEGYIGDASEIIKMGPAGTNQLTATGVKDVLSTRALAMKDIDQHGIQQTRASVMKWAYSQMVVDHEMLFPGLPPRKDKKGEDAYDGTFVPKVNAAYAQFMQKSGANPLEFWTQDNMKTLMSGIRSPAEVAAERTLGGLQKPVAREPIPAAPPEVNENSWKTILNAPPVTKDGREWPTMNWARAIEALRHNPTPESIKSFDAAFGAAGYSGQEILNRLKTDPKMKPTAPPVSMPMPAMSR